MNDFQNTPRDNYIMKADWKQLRVLTQHWQSDLEFHRDEIKFLHHLVNKYIMWLTRYEEVEMVRKIKKMLAQVGRECRELLGKVGTHLRHLSDLIENPYAYDSQAFLNEHGELEEGLVAFTKHFRLTKKETFKITENLMDSEEVAEHL